MDAQEQLQKMLDGFDDAKVQDIQLSILIGGYLDWYGCWSAWLEEPVSNLRDDDFHAAAFRTEKVLSFSWKGKTVYLTKNRIQEALTRIS